MMIFQNAGLALLAVPKTGSTAYLRALGSRADIVMRFPPEVRHMRADAVRSKVLPLFGSHAPRIEMVAVIREPVDWLGSWFRYRRDRQFDGTRLSTTAIDFDAFVRAYLGQERPPFAKIGAQSRFVSNADGEVIVDHLFAFERQEALHAFLVEKLGAPLPDMARVNTSVEMPLSLSPETEARLRRERASCFGLHEQVLRGS